MGVLTAVRKGREGNVMEFDELMKAFGASLGLGDFKPDENGVFSLSVDETVVSFVAQPERGFVETVARICDLPAVGADGIFKVLLSAMSPGGAAEGFTFFVPPEASDIYLRRTDALANLDVEALRLSLERFANALDDWRASIRDFREVAPVIDEVLARQTDENRSLAAGESGFLRA